MRRFEDGSAATAAAFEALWPEMKARGHGTISRTEEGLEMAAGALRQYKDRRSIKFNVLIDILHFLDIEPGEFFGGVFGGSDHIRKDRSRTTYEAKALNTANELQYKDPFGALRKLAEIRGVGEHDSYFCRLTGGIFRLIEMGSVAQSWLLRSADLARDRLEEAKCRLLLSPVLSLNFSKPVEGLELANKLEKFFLHCCDSQLTALSKLYQAIANFRLEDYPETLKLSESALKEVDVSLQTTTALHQLRGVVYSATGDRQQALTSLEIAASMSKENLTSGHVLWARARLEDSMAPSLYRQAIVKFGPGYLYHAAEAAIELVERFGLQQLDVFDLIATLGKAREHRLFTEVLLQKRTALVDGRDFDGIGALRHAWKRYRSSQARRLGFKF